jgi:hypothetical protein
MKQIEKIKKEFEKKFVGITQGTKRVWWVDSPDRVLDWIIKTLQAQKEDIADDLLISNHLGFCDQTVLVGTWYEKEDIKEMIKKVRQDTREEVLEEVESNMGITADHYGLLGDGSGNKQMFLFIGSNDWKKLINKLKNK